MLRTLALRREEHTMLPVDRHNDLYDQVGIAGGLTFEQFDKKLDQVERCGIDVPFRGKSFHMDPVPGPGETPRL